MWIKKADKRFFWILGAAVVATFALGFTVLTEAGVIPTTSEYCYKDEYTNQKECARDSTPLFAIWEIAKFFEDNNAVFAAFATIVIAAFTVTLARVGRQQVKDTAVALSLTREAAASSEKALLVSERPWLRATLELRQEGIVMEPSQTRLMVKVVLLNFGRSPAVDLEIELEFCPLDADSRGHFRRLCRSARENAPHRNIHVWEPIFPNSTVHENPSISVRIDREAIRLATESWQDRRINPVVIGCVTYKSPFSDERLQTAFTYDLRHIDPSQPGFLKSFEVDETGKFTAAYLSRKHLSLEQDFVDGAIH